MTRHMMLSHEFVEFIPDELNEGTLYICMGLATVVHKCCCGCGNEVVTPLSPTDWKLTFDGETITLYPSIGNWGFKCQSHYWVEDSQVRWAPRWSRRKIDAERVRDRLAKKRYFDTFHTTTDSKRNNSSATAVAAQEEPDLWQKVKNWWQRL